MSGFRLESEEIAREIHHILREEYPKMNIDGRAINDCISGESDKNSGRMIFELKVYCRKCGLDVNAITGKLISGFEIEFEKNLHDKVLFNVRLVDGNLEFSKTENKLNG